jgi:hypothetical protein
MSLIAPFFADIDASPRVIVATVFNIPDVPNAKFALASAFDVSAADDSKTASAGAERERGNSKEPAGLAIRRRLFSCVKAA